MLKSHNKYIFIEFDFLIDIYLTLTTNKKKKKTKQNKNKRIRSEFIYLIFIKRHAILIITKKNKVDYKRNFLLSSKIIRCDIHLEKTSQIINNFISLCKIKSRVI